MANSRNDLTQSERFLKRAEEDLNAALVLQDGQLYRDVCYFSQQCMEKAIKAFLILKGKFQVTHTPSATFLEEIKKTPGKWKDPLMEAHAKSKVLADYWIKTRYPDVEWREYDEKEAQEAVDNAQSILETMQKFLKEEFGVKS